MTAPKGWEWLVEQKTCDPDTLLTLVDMYGDKMREGAFSAVAADACAEETKAAMLREHADGQNADAAWFRGQIKRLLFAGVKRR